MSISGEYTEEQLNMFEHFVAAKHLLPLKPILEELEGVNEDVRGLIIEKFLTTLIMHGSQAISSYLNIMNQLEGRVYVPDEIEEEILKERRVV